MPDHWEFLVPHRFVGSQLPASIAEIKWKECSGSQQYGYDCLGNEWIREGSTLWTTLTSEYREFVFLPLTLSISDNEVTAVELEAYASHGPCHGRPEYIEPRTRESQQATRLLKELFKQKHKKE
jgi:hypothetical protein